MKKILFFLFCYFPLMNAGPEEDQIKLQICQVLPTLEGWCSREKALNFFDLVIETKPKIYVEIGVFGGASLFPVASALKYLGEGIIIGIDPWDKIECIKYYDPILDQANLKWWGNLNIDYIRRSFINMIKKHDLENYCQIIRATSEKAISQIGPIDILYIDGNHSEEVSLRDVTLYLPKVRTGGYIWMNDTLWEERQLAVESLLESCDVIKLIDDGNCILFRKR